jgi:hypothetical protein
MRTKTAMVDRSRSRRSPALGSRIIVAAAATAATIALVGWMGRPAGASGVEAVTAAAPPIIRRVVVVEAQPDPEPYITLEAAPAGRTVTVVTQPARVVSRTTAAAPAASVAPAQVAAPVTTSSGS